MPYFLVNESKIYPDFGSICKWVAIGGKDPNAHVKFNLMRVDSSSVSITNSSGNTQFASISYPPAGLTVGGKIYMIVYNSGSVVLAEGLFNILSFSGSTLVVNVPFNASFSFARFNFITDYANYRFRVVHQTTDDSGASWDTVATSDHFPSPNQQTWVDASPFLQPSVKIQSKAIPLTVINDVADFMDKQCMLTVYEVYDYDSTHIDQISVNSGSINLDIFIVNAANQIQNPYGISLIDKINDDDNHQPLKFLCDFVKPTWFAEFPFHLTYIYPELLNDDIDYKHDNLDYNGSSLASASAVIDPTKIGHVNRLYIRNAITAGTVTVRAYIQKHTGGAVVSELKLIKYQYCTKKNPVCLKWMGATGAWNFWVFSVNQIHGINITSRDGQFGTFVADLALADTDTDWISKEGFPEMIMGANDLDKNDLDGLRSMLVSPKVMILQNPEDWFTVGDRWLTVKIPVGKFKIKEEKSNGNNGSFEITAVFPEIYTQIQ